MTAQHGPGLHTSAICLLPRFGRQVKLAAQPASIPALPYHEISLQCCLPNSPSTPGIVRNLASLVSWCRTSRLRQDCKIQLPPIFTALYRNVQRLPVNSARPNGAFRVAAAASCDSRILLCGEGTSSPWAGARLGST